MEKIFGVGLDLVSCVRIQNACEKESFLKKYYSEEEQALMKERSSRAATNFAGKEAVVKALGTGFAGIHPKEIQILRNPNGAPYVVLTGHAKEIAEQLHIVKLHISLTDTKEYASAYVVAIAEG